MIFYKYTFMQNGSLYFPAEDAGLQSVAPRNNLSVSFFIFHRLPSSIFGG